MKFGFTQHTKVLVAGRHEPEGIRALANLYWRVLLASFFLITIAVLVYGILGTLQILHNLNGPGTTSTLPPPSLDRAALKAVIEGFGDRQSQFDLLKTRPEKVIPDPSR